MFLLSGVIFKSGNQIERESQSRVSTEESVHLFGGLETVFENIENSLETTSKMASQSTNPFVDEMVEFGPTAESSRQGSRNYKMMLTYLYVNTHGAKIYGDPLDRLCVKIEDILTKFQPEPLVNY